MTESESVTNNLEHTVIELEKIGNISFPPTDRLSGKFIIVNNHIFVINYYGHLGMYHLETGYKNSEFHFKFNEVENIATDGKFLYLKLQGSFEVKNDDVLLAKVKENDKMSDGIGEIISFIDLPLKELPEEIYGKEISVFNKKSEELGIASRIVSVDLEKLKFPSIVYWPDGFTDENTRFLVHRDMGLNVFLTSQNGFIIGSYRPDADIGGFCDNFFLKNGKLYEPSEAELKENITYSKLRVYTSSVDPYGFNIFINTSHAEKNLRMIFKNEKPSTRKYILGLFHQDDKIYILYDQITGEGHGITPVYHPNELITYKAKLRRLI